MSTGTRPSTSRSSSLPLPEDLASAHPAPGRGRRIAIEVALVLGGFALVAIAHTWPMILELDSHAHSRIDPLFDAWTIDWVQHSLRHPSELFQANIFAPERDTLAYSHAQLGTGVLLLPARWIGLSPVGVLNVGLLAGFTLSAASAYLFGRVATGSRVVAVVAGLAYSFGPVGTAQAGHVFMVMRPGPPLAAAAVWWLADRAKRDASLWLPAAGLAATLAWQASNSFYLTVFTVVVALVVAAVRFRSFGRRGFAFLAGATAAGGVVIALMAIPYLRVRDRFPGIEWTLDGISAFGAHFTEVDYRDRLWAPLLGAPTGSATEKAFPGLVVLALVVCAVVVARRLAAPAAAGVVGGHRAHGRRLADGDRCVRRGMAPVHALPPRVRGRPRVHRAARHGPGVDHRHARPRAPRRARPRVGARPARAGVVAGPGARRCGLRVPPARGAAHGRRGTDRVAGLVRGARASGRRRAGGARRARRRPLPADELHALPHPRHRRVPPADADLRHDRAPPPHAQRLLRVLAAVVRPHGPRHVRPAR